MLKKVLIVDDDAGIVNLLSRLVIKRGHQPLVATDGVKALVMARENCPDLIFTDLLMPDLTGIELVHLLKSEPELAHIPLVILSGTATTLDMDDVVADDVLSKPFQLQTVYDVLDRYLSPESPPHHLAPDISFKPSTTSSFEESNSNYFSK